VAGAAALRRVAIIGCGGHAREQVELIAAVNAVQPEFVVEGFLADPDFAPAADPVRGLAVLGPPEWLAEQAGAVLGVCAMGDPDERVRMVARLASAGVRFATLVHPTAVVGGSVTLGEGAIVCAGSVLTSEVSLGDHVHVGVGSIVSHDCALGAYASLAPGCRLAGVVTVEQGAQLGVGTVVRDRVRVGEWSRTGAGAVVVGDVPANATVVGVPARVIDTRLPGWQREAPSFEPRESGR